MSDSAEQLERIRAHVRSYGMIPEAEGHNVADVIENYFVAHCAVDVCSAGNEPGSHWCKRHANFLAEAVKRHARGASLADVAEAVLASYFNDDPAEREKVVVHLERLDDALDDYREAD